MADVKQVSSGTKLESIGTVKTVVGTVKAVDASGAERILQAGDHVFANETIVTADGGLVLIEFANGSHLDLGSHDHIVLDSSVYTPTEASESKGGELSAEQIQEMIARGEDPTAVTEATAAGVGAGDEGGSSFIVVDYNNIHGNVTSGFQTHGIPGPDSTTLTELPPVEDTPVTILAALSTTPIPTEETPPVIEPPIVKHGNNGFGNGDQDAPGGSGPHNNAENATDNNGNNGGGNNGGDNNHDNTHANNGIGNDDQDAPGGSGPHNNAENATDTNNNSNNNSGGESNDNPHSNNGGESDDQDAPGGSDPHNNAGNAPGNNGNNNGGENADNTHGNNGWGNDDQDAPGGSGPHNNAENAAGSNDNATVTGTKGNDILTGSNDNDILIGQGGDDSMTGGAGADKFVWEKGDLKGTAHGDTITDFNVAQGDTLKVDDLLANTKGAVLGLVDNGTDTTVTITTGNSTVTLVTLNGVTGETLNALLGTHSPD